LKKIFWLIFNTSCGRGLITGCAVAQALC